MNKPQAEGKVNSRLYSRTQKKKAQHSSAIEKQRSTIVSLSKVIFCLLVWLNWTIKGKQQTHWLIKLDYIYLCCLTYVIIAGLRHILSLHFTVLIHFDEY